MRRVHAAVAILLVAAACGEGPAVPESTAAAPSTTTLPATTAAPPTTLPAATLPPATLPPTTIAAPVPVPEVVRPVPGSTRKICQLTGDVDRQAGAPTGNSTDTRYGIWGTDLGSSFEHDGTLFFLFGDTVGVRSGDLDLLARSDDRDPEDCIDLEFPTAADGWFRPLEVPGVAQGAFEVPTGGFSLDGSVYIYLFTGYPEATRSVLARSSDGGRTFEALSEFSTGGFRNVAPVLTPEGGLPAAPGDGDGVVLFGSGEYRASDAYLAFVPRATVADPGGTVFFAGLDPGSGEPTWSDRESDAEPLFDQSCLGELSAAWNQPLGRWLLLYNCGDPRGINLRSAPDPWGPWSEPDVLFDPWDDGGYCGFIHASWDDRRCDEVHDPNRGGEWGGEYGPYLIDRFTVGVEGRSTVYFTMSTWNPYQVVLMAADLMLGG